MRSLKFKGILNWLTIGVLLINLSNCSWPGSLFLLLQTKGSSGSKLIFFPASSTDPEKSKEYIPESPLNTQAPSNNSTNEIPSTPSEPSDPTVAGIIVSRRTGVLTTEGGGTDTVTIHLTKAPTADVILNLTSLNTGEVTVSPSSLTFTSSNWSVNQTITFTGQDDFIQDGNKSVTIDLGYLLSSDSEYNSLSAGTIEVINVDNDIAGLTVTPLGGLVTTEAGGTATFTVVLNSQPTHNVTIPVVSNDTTEGTVSTTSLLFTPSNWNIPQTVTIMGVDDLIADGNVNYTVDLQASSSSDPNYSGLSQPNIGVTNQDNDTAGFTITNSNLATNESGTSATFFVVLTSQPINTVTIPLTVLDPTEGTINKSSLTFSTTSWNIAQSVTVTGVDDSDLDGNVNYQIVVGAPVSSDTSYSTLSPQSVFVTNVDNDSPGFDITAVNRNTIEDGTTAFFRVRLLTIPIANVTITFTSLDTTEGIIISGASLTFTPTNWNTYQNVTIKGVNDSLQDGDITYTIQSNPATSSDPNYNGLNPADVTVINQDDDTAGFVLNYSADPLVTTESAGKATFTVRLRTKPTANVTFTGISSSNTLAGTVSPTSLTFTPTNWSVPQTVTITGVNNDYDNDAGIPYTVTVPSPTSADPSYNGLTPKTVNVLNQDNDTKGYTFSKTKNFITGDSGLTDTFTFRLNTQPVGGDVVIPVSSSNPSELIVSPSVLTFTSANWNVPQTITLQGVSDGGSLDGAKIVTVALGTASAGSGYKNYFPNATGSDYDNVQITDYNGATANNGVITVNNCDTDVKIAVCLPQSSERQTNESGSGFQYYIVLNQAPTAPVTINITSSNPSEGTTSVSSIVKDASNWNTIQLITVSGVNDPALEAIGEQLDGNQTYSIIHSVASSSDPYFNGFDVADITGIVNVDPDTPNIIFTPASTSSSRITLVNGQTITMTARLNAKPSANVSFTMSTTGFTVSPATLTFNSSNWNVDQTFTVTFSGTSGNKTLATTNFTSTDTKFNGKTTNDIFFNVVEPGLTLGTVSGPTDETGTTRTFTVRLNSPPSANVTVTVVSTNTNEVIITGGATLTFTPANWNTNQTVTIKGVDDGDLDGDQNVIIQLTTSSADSNYNSLPTYTLTVTNIDND